MVEYDIGDAIAMTAIFTNTAGTPTAPTTVTFKVKDPAGTETSTVAPNASITNPSTGTYVFSVPTFTMSGTYALRAVGTGAVASASEITVSVRVSEFGGAVIVPVGTVADSLAQDVAFTSRYAPIALGLSVDGNLITRTAGFPAEMTRAALAADTAFSAVYAPITLGKVAYAEITANSTAVSATTDAGLSATWTAVAGRRYRTTVQADWYGSIVGDLLVAYITDGSGTQKERCLYVVANPLVGGAGYGHLTMSYIEVPGAGSVTRKVRHERNSGTGTSTIGAAALSPAWILVEDIGT